MSKRAAVDDSDSDTEVVKPSVRSSASCSYLHSALSDARVAARDQELTAAISPPTYSESPQPNKKARKVTIEEDDDVQMIASEPEADEQADEDDAEYEAENEERIRAEIQSQAKNKETGVSLNRLAIDLDCD